MYINKFISAQVYTENDITNKFALFSASEFRLASFFETVDI